MRTVAVIGSGVAGLSAALSLSEMGIPSVILERQDRLGGTCTELGCKGMDACVRCDVCLARNKADLVRSSPGIERQKCADVQGLTGEPGDFRLRFTSGEGRERSIRVGAVICATGAKAFDASADKRLGYGTVPGVMTSLDLERGLSATGAAWAPSSRAPPASVAFVQCVGSRDSRFQPRCSGFCCKSSFKLAQALVAKAPDCSIDIFYMDLRLMDPRENIRQWSSSSKGVNLVRARPAEVLRAEDGRPQVRWAAEGDGNIEERAYDLVVLAVGLLPGAEGVATAGVLGIEADAQGFLVSSASDQWSSTRAGVFLAGCCRAPMDIPGSAKDGAAAALRAATMLEAGP